MSKTTPVRWWRSDEDRYKPRAAYKAPEQPAPTRWDIELIAGPPDPLLKEMLDRFNELASPQRLAASLGIPLRLLFSDEPEDPLVSVKRALRLTSG